jgi:hypothetical protein
MVAPRQIERGGAGSITAAPITQPPFAPLGLVKIAEGRAAEADRRETGQGIS